MLTSSAFYDFLRPVDMKKPGQRLQSGVFVIAFRCLGFFLSLPILSGPQA